MIEYLLLIWFFITHPGMLIFAIALSGEFGFWFVQSLVVWYDWTNETMTLLSPDYIWFWIIVAIIVMVVFGIPFWWMAVSLSKIAKNMAAFLVLRIGQIRKKE
jgi:hypothetical protein